MRYTKVSNVVGLAMGATMIATFLVMTMWVTGRPIDDGIMGYWIGMVVGHAMCAIYAFVSATRFR